MMKEYNTKEYVCRFSNVVRLGLERITLLLEYLDNPQDRLKFVHVAGTNGKGSVCAFIEAGLIAAGKKTGKFTSPNLVRVNERICIDGQEIADSDLEGVLSAVGAAASKVKETLGEMPTQFEIWTAASMYWFFINKCDIVVMEVGLGGEFDATNVIKSCEIAVITHIDYDHTEYLGDTIGQIASAKCGIIKPDTATRTVVSAPQYEEALEVIKKTCEKYNLRLTVADNPPPGRHSGIYETVSLRGVDEIHLSLAGVYQISNAALASEVLAALGIGKAFIKKGLETAVNHARFEKLGEKLIFDGGHNPDGIRALSQSLDRYFPDAEMNVIYACMSDKDKKSVLDILNNGRRKFIFTTVSGNSRAMPAEALQKFAYESCGIDGICAADLKEAIETAEQTQRLTIICGSLYLYADLPDKYRK